VFGDGSTYVGEFQYGKENGHGILTWPNGVEYEGEFTNGLCSGIGNHRYPNDGDNLIKNTEIDCRNDNSFNSGVLNHNNNGYIVNKVVSKVKM
jgi:hypothetical protein